jgi:hypothetical protein
MSPLEKLFRHEIEFHRRLREASEGMDGSVSLHTSYALCAGYEGLMLEMSVTTWEQIDQLANRLGLAGDSRDVMRARDSVRALLTMKDSRPRKT